MIAPFCDLAPDGTLVVCHDGALTFNATVVPTHATPMFARATLDALRRPITASKAHDPNSGPVILARADGFATAFDQTYGNSPVVLAQFGALTHVVWIRSQTEWAYTDVDASGVIGAITRLPLPPNLLGTSDGIKDLDEFGQPIWMEPVDQVINGVTFRYAPTRQGVTVGQWIFGWEDQLLVARDGQVGTLWEGLADEPHLQVLTDGTVWAAWRDRETPRTMRIPDVLPPFLSKKPIPPPPVLPSRNLALLTRGRMPLSVISSTQLKPSVVAGKYTVTLPNPLDRDYDTIGTKGTVLGPFNDDKTPKYLGTKTVYSPQPDGTPEVRPEGTDAAFEQCRKVSGCLLHTGFGNVALLTPYDGQ